MFIGGVGLQSYSYSLHLIMKYKIKHGVAEFMEADYKDIQLYKGWFYDHITKKMYRWADFMHLVKSRNKDNES